jgi:flagellar hook-basal body complex protein FliE
MEMTSIGPIGNSIGSLHQEVLKRAEQNLGKGAGVADFSDRIGDALNQVASSQSDSANLTKAYEMGTEHDLSKVMVQQQVSSLGFQMTLNVRNKVLSAYKDIMNMPV